MTMLECVKQKLNENPNAIIAEVHDEFRGPRDLPGFSKHELHFLVAPLYPLFDTQSLQAFMLSLLPGMKVDEQIDCERIDAWMIMGKLMVKETMEMLQREIWVDVYPNKPSAESALFGEHFHKMSVTDMAFFSNLPSVAA